MRGCMASSELVGRHPPFASRLTGCQGLVVNRLCFLVLFALTRVRTRPLLACLPEPAFSSIIPGGSAWCWAKGRLAV